jgi:hypothetical protein
MAWKAGDTVIITQEGINRVGVILDKFYVSKQTMYDILIENRSAITMVNSSTHNKTYINKVLTKLLCESEKIITTIPYDELVASESLPIVRA